MNEEEEEAAELLQDHAEELGFVNKARVEDSSLYVERREGEIAGAALVDHLKTASMSWLRDIAVAESYRRKGVGKSLVEKIREDSPHPVLKAKCPVDLEANKFYSRTGWELEETIEVEDGRDLNVWLIGWPSVSSAADSDW